jgi:hypothetical protein
LSYDSQGNLAVADEYVLFVTVVDELDEVETKDATIEADAAMSAEFAGVTTATASCAGIVMISTPL